MATLLDLQIKQSRILLKNPYAYLDGEGGFSAIIDQSASTVHKSRHVSGNHLAFSGISSQQLLNGKRKGDSFSKDEIVVIARKLQKVMWKNRNSIWPEKASVTPHEILAPSLALRRMGYKFDLCESLGQHSSKRGVFEVAGTIDDTNLRVKISRKFSKPIQNFTAAHELGHAVLHQASGLHRDRPLDGTETISRDKVESEADSFAVCFLMPEKLVKSAFKKMFLAENFTINEYSAFALGFSTEYLLKKEGLTLRKLSKLLAETKKYNGRFYEYSLAEQFSVSITAMAIRLEELGLVRQ